MDTRSGIEENTTLATAEKGKLLLEQMIKDFAPFMEKFAELEV